jgi:hypothetical protein
LTVDQSGSDVLTGIIGARRAWTVSMISARRNADDIHRVQTEMRVIRIDLDSY